MMNALSETAKYRHLTQQYCQGVGIDIGSGGDPVVPWAVQMELPPNQYAMYNGGDLPRGPVQMYGDAQRLPFLDSSLDFVYNSHLLEDFSDWNPLLIEWHRVLKHGGKLVIIVPDKELFRLAVARGQPDNPAHRHEANVGELTACANPIGFRVIEDHLTKCFEGDYSILFAAEKL